MQSSRRKRFGEKLRENFFPRNTYKRLLSFVDPLLLSGDDKVGLGLRKKDQFARFDLQQSGLFYSMGFQTVFSPVAHVAMPHNKRFRFIDLRRANLVDTNFRAAPNRMESKVPAMSERVDNRRPEKCEKSIFFRGQKFLFCYF
jgi:hypothetical protein